MTEPSSTGPAVRHVAPPQSADAASDIPWIEQAWARIKEHKVAQWTLAYAAGAYTLLHVIEMVAGAFEWPELIVRLVTVLLALGLPLAAVLAWYHGAKAQHRVSGPELTIITLLLVVVGTVLWAMTRTTDHSAAAPAAVAGEAAMTATNPRTSIAVMPFVNLTGDATKDYLGDGMAEELIITLAKVPGLKVPARTSTFAYKGRNTDIRQIAKDLGVGTVLEGSVRAAGNRIRITAQLISASDGLHIWSETYEEQFTDLFALQDKLAAAIATALEPNLHTAVESVVAQGPPTRDVEAYNLFLQGEALLQRTSEQNAAKAIEYFRQAVARDPKFARAYAAIAGAHLALGSFGRPAEHLAAAERAARKALALDSNLAHMALALIHAQRGQHLAMEEQRRAAVALAPNDGLIRSLSALLLSQLGHVKQGLDEAEEAYALAPANPQVVARLASAHTSAGHDREAVKYADAAADLGYPKDSWPLPAIYELSALRAKRYVEAAAIATRRLDVRDPDQARTAEVIRLVYAALADPSRRKAAIAARARLYPASGTGAARIDVPLCLRSSRYYALMGANDVSYGLVKQCLEAAKGQAHPSSAAGLGLNAYIPELRAFRQDSRFLATEWQYLMAYWRKYDPPDDCDLKGDKLTCH
jgi:TolB-like protein